MRIVFAMAAVAVQCCFAVALTAHVAFIALHLVMFAPQQKIGFAMVEFLFVKVSNSCITPLVVGMAGAAGWICNTPMESTFVARVSSDILVASHAQAILCFAVKLDVALLAVILKFDVALDDFAGSHDRFNPLCHRRATDQYAQHLKCKAGDRSP